MEQHNDNRFPNSNAINNLIGNNIRAIRKTKNLSQTQVANNLGVSYQQLQKYETGKNSLSSFRIYQIAQFFDIGLDDIFSGVPKNENNKPNIPETILKESVLKDPKIKEIIHLLSQIEDDQSLETIYSLLKKLR